MARGKGGKGMRGFNQKGATVKPEVPEIPASNWYADTDTIDPDKLQQEQQEEQQNDPEPPPPAATTATPARPACAGTWTGAS